MVRAESPSPAGGVPRAQRMTKKHQIAALYLSGMTDIEDLAMITNTRPSYVGAVLQDAGLLQGYFDLYTSTAHPMNVYSKLFANKLGFKNVDAARCSVAVIDHLYTQFALTGDRAGQHHALSMALVMFDRARWTGKTSEADIFRQWLVAHLEVEEPTTAAPTAATAALVLDTGTVDEVSNALMPREHGTTESQATPASSQRVRRKSLTGAASTGE